MNTTNIQFSDIKGGCFVDSIVNKNQNTSQSMKSHYHAHYELYYSRQGVRYYVISGKTLTVNPGDIVLIKPNVLHSTYGTAYSRFLCNFSDKWLRDCFSPVMADKLLSCFSYNLFPRELLAKYDVASIIAEIEAVYAENSDEVFPLIAKLLLTLNKIDPDTVSDLDENAVITRIFEYISTNYAQDVNLDSLSRQLNINKFYLCHMFKKYTNQSINKYLIDTRIQHASKELKSTNKSITEIAVSNGFNSPTHFINSFKKALGVTPLAYRKKAKTQ